VADFERLDFLGLQSLSDFQLLWDTMNDTRRYYALSELERTAFVSPGVKRLGNSNVLRSLVIRTANMLPAYDPREPNNALPTNILVGSYFVTALTSAPAWVTNDLPPIKATHALVCSFRAFPGGEQSIVIPAAVCEVPVDTQGYLIQLTEKSRKWYRGPFASSFSQLNRVLHGRLKRDFADLVEDLEERVESSKDNVSVMGAQLPRSILAYWGAIILLCVQAYFVAYLRWYTRRHSIHSGDVDFPWFGFFSDPLSKALFVVSAVALPVIAAVCLGVSALASHPLRLRGTLTLLLLFPFGALGVKACVTSRTAGKRVFFAFLTLAFAVGVILGIGLAEQEGVSECWCELIPVVVMTPCVALAWMTFDAIRLFWSTTGSKVSPG
jgi:hypothetical protein